jgi:hypothetical protein
MLQEVALLTDGRFSGGSHGFVVGHICPEAQVCYLFISIFLRKKKTPTNFFFTNKNCMTNIMCPEFLFRKGVQLVCDSFILGIPSCFVSNLQNHKNTVHQEPSTCLACALQLVYIYIHIHVQIKKYAQILSFIFSFDPNNIFMFFSPFSCMTFV